MKQVLQNLKTGSIDLYDVPTPQCRPGHLLIASRRTLISAGTERMLVEFGQANLLAKARSQPDRVKQVLDKMRTDGVLPTLESVFNRLDQPLPLGYCNAGVVIDVGAGVDGFSIGDRVISNGPHAEIVSIPKHLCAKIPHGVDDDSAAFTVLSSIALQGIRLVDPTIGEKVVVTGLGLIGLMTVQLLVANGCQVLGLDLNPQRLELAKRFGAEVADLSSGADPVKAGMEFSGGKGVDAVIITASTKSSDPVHQAAQMCRKRGRIVLVGVTGLELQRADFYEKELTFQVSCSYGPGRYDNQYEQMGHDYPLGFVRWTEQRNFEAVLSLMQSKRLDVSPLITHTVQHANAEKAYESLTTESRALGILLAYPEDVSTNERVISIGPRSESAGQAKVVAGVIGSGNYANVVFLPALAKSKARLKMIVSGGGTSAAVSGKRFNFEQVASDADVLMADSEIDTVFVLTRHNSHAKYICQALEAGKHVFVEKPIALNREEFAAVEAAVNANPERQLMVGFNRRYAPLSIETKRLLAGRVEPLSIIYTVNAGAIPLNHWTQDAAVGGGRIIGEACHFIDLIHSFVDRPLVGVKALQVGTSPSSQDKMTILLSFQDGSIGTVHYLANGSKQFPKERVEIFSEGRILSLDNFRTLKGYGWPGFSQKRLMRQDKGHAAGIEVFLERVEKGGEWLIPWSTFKEVFLATLVAVEQAQDKGHILE